MKKKKEIYFFALNIYNGLSIIYVSLDFWPSLFTLHTPSKNVDIGQPSILFDKLNILQIDFDLIEMGQYDFITILWHPFQIKRVCIIGVNISKECKLLFQVSAQVVYQLSLVLISTGRLFWRMSCCDKYIRSDQEPI